LIKTGGKSMLYRQLNKTGVDLSILGFGCMRLPTIDHKHDRIDYPKATQLLHYAIEHGVNYVDTAYFYHAAVFGQRGESEPFVGEALSGGWRKKVHLATKMPLFQLRQKEQMSLFLEEQLERLKTDYLDFYLLHGLNGETWDRMRDLGVREFLDKKKTEGKLRFPAFSFHGKAEDFIRICDDYNWTFAQIQYNYMDIDFQAGNKGLKYAADKGIGIVAMEPLKGGKLAQNLPTEMKAVLNTSAIKRSPAEWALRFVWNEAGVSSLLSGMNSMEQVTENIKVADDGIQNSLSTDELLMFDTLRKAMGARIKADCTDCRYCMPCTSGVNIPDVLAAVNNAAIWNDPNPWMTGYTQVRGKAGKCTECKECEEVCPQELPISTLMKEAVSLFRE
jgi:predicted aldo/keto reductase-like oxidoreductase